MPDPNAAPLTSMVLTHYVRRNPGLTCEQIAAAFGVLPARMSIELRQLRKAGKLKSEGNTRGTKWTVAARGCR